MKFKKLSESKKTNDYLSIKEINWLKDNPGQEIEKTHYKVSYNDYINANTNEPMGGHFTVIENQGRDATRVDGVQELKDYIVRRYNKYFEESISSNEPVVKFQGKSSHTFTKDKKWEVDFDEAGNILARTRHGKPSYFKGHINDKINDFPSTDEDNIILAAREQHKLKFGNKEINENYWIDNKEVMDKVDKLEKQLDSEGWKSYADRHSGSAYYSIFINRINDEAVAKAVVYNHNIEPQIIDITIDQAIGKDSLDSFDGMRRKLGKMLLPQNESVSSKVDYKSFIKEIVPSKNRISSIEPVYGFDSTQYLETRIEPNDDVINDIILELENRGFKLVDSMNPDDNGNEGWVTYAGNYAGNRILAVIVYGPGYATFKAGYVEDEDKDLFESMGNKFKVGDTFEHAGLYGGQYTSKINAIQGGKILVKTSWVAEDSGRTVTRPNAYEIEVDENGNERIVVWEYNGEKGYVYAGVNSLEEGVDTQYGVHQFSTDSIIFRGTEEECGKYIDERKELWDDAEVYMMTPSDPHYKKESNDDLTEAHYGGAYDIADDQYFTKDDLMSFAEEVLGHISETFNGLYDIGGVWFEKGNLITTIVDESDDEFTNITKIDMRKIKEPWHLKRTYAMKVAADIIEQIKDLESDVITEDVDSINNPKIDMPEPGLGTGLSNAIIALINDEWEAIEGYNSFIATLAAENALPEAIDVIKDIANEENLHVGQLQKLLQIISPNADSITAGEKEADRQVQEFNNEEVKAEVTED